jgi:hypothetical protein
MAMSSPRSIQRLYFLVVYLEYAFGSENSGQIAFGRYSFSSVEVADGDGPFALDGRDIFNSESIGDAMSVYQNGTNAVTSDYSGSV